ncbi:class A beta-lactamase [Litoreibacter roseus]|uniref:beta-lactamase n=1 Tax=Litoreibacter roseus TaxID=2601869 RepID=A0A6N6JCG3_9RHOB|nr:class A beta-lactamase [Litoreibacter roseus]GFE63846.1 hypothetical protein KIN_09200 [Litoreibacter roseus]
MSLISRRTLIASLASCVAIPGLGQERGLDYREWQPRTYDDGLIPNFSFEVIELSLLGDIGVYALDSENDRASGWSEDYRQPSNSTVKFLIATAVLYRVDAGQERLDRGIHVDDMMPLSHSPVLENAHGDTMPVSAICAAMMTRSDNAAANLLLESLGGPQSLTLWLRQMGDQVTRVDRYLPDLTTPPESPDSDSTTPAQMVRNMRTFLTGSAQLEGSRLLLKNWMTENATGAHRLRAGVPQGWQVADRTGTGSDGRTSTIAAIYPLIENRCSWPST